MMNIIKNGLRIDIRKKRMDKRIFSIIYDIKGVLSYEKRRKSNSIRPKIELNTRKEAVHWFITKFLIEYDIKHCIIEREQKNSKFTSVRVSSKINCYKLAKFLLDSKYCRFAVKDFEQMKLFCKPKLKKDKK